MIKNLGKFLLVNCLVLSLAEAKMVVTYRAAESDSDKRYNYDKSVLQLALEKTKAEFGDYELRPSEAMNFTRAINDMERNITLNFIIKQSYESRYKDKKMDFAKFPVDLGIVGFRVCLTNISAQKRLGNVKTLDDLRKFSHGQGQDWSDVEILRHHKFNVVTSASYESLFDMVALERFDLFCRGTNEILDEYNAHKNIKGLTYDKSFSIAYPLPRFFYSNKNNKKLLARIEKGLIIAYNDGSLKELWKKEYGDSVRFANLKQRKIFYFDNPNLKDVNFDYQKYFFNPLKDSL
jgi:hypothetical protein